MGDLDRLGELMFGRKLRLKVLLWAWERDGEFHQTDAAKGVDYSSTGEVGKELERLVDLGMLRKFGRPSGVGAQFYGRIEEHPGWGIARAAWAAVSPDPGAGTPPEEEEAEPPPIARLGGGGPRGPRGGRPRRDDRR